MILLQNYSDTSYPAKNVTPAPMSFRELQRFSFPRQTIADNQVAKARETDYSKKEHRQQDLSAAKYVKKDNFQIGDTVFIKNFDKMKIFDPLFLDEP